MTYTSNLSSAKTEKKRLFGNRKTHFRLFYQISYSMVL